MMFTSIDFALPICFLLCIMSYNIYSWIDLRETARPSLYMVIARTENVILLVYIFYFNAGKIQLFFF